PGIINEAYFHGFHPMRGVMVTIPFMLISVGSIDATAIGKKICMQRIKGVANMRRPDRRGPSTIPRNPTRNQWSQRPWTALLKNLLFL
ncbi:MAG: hypothetical protein ABIE47_16705, partial [Pseudomonadota bacterium]